jgi:hypothetical protein
MGYTLLKYGLWAMQALLNNAPRPAVPPSA